MVIKNDKCLKYFSIWVVGGLEQILFQSEAVFQSRKLQIKIVKSEN